MKLSALLEKQRVLLETPQQIADLDEKEFLDIAANRALYEQLKNQRKKLIKRVAPGASLYQLSFGRLCVLDDKQRHVAYWMTFQVGKHPLIGKFVWQSLVWKFHRISTPYLHGVPSEVFFEYLLPKVGTIITDGEQTFNGELFWRDRITDAFSKKLNVYFFNFANDEFINIRDHYHLAELEKTHEIWGPSDLHRMKRILITKKDYKLLENRLNKLQTPVK